MSELSSRSYNQLPQEQIAQTAEGLGIILAHSRGKAHVCIDPRLPVREAAEFLGQRYHLRVEDTSELMRNRFRPLAKDERGAIVVGYSLEEDAQNGYAHQKVIRSRHNQTDDPSSVKLLVLTESLPDAGLTDDAGAPFWNGPISYGELWRVEPAQEGGMHLSRMKVGLGDQSYEWQPDASFDFVI
ncbi:MAG TPA: hypothetical protein VFT53_06810 [Candidatus Saccharimonadales bacterium]|nr:hypothetical protein [Candidatus Saccharimonadales bacterium]